VSYRLLTAEWGAGRGRFGFNYTSYFDVLDIGEAVGHEFAGAWLDAGRRRPSMTGLPFRRLIEDSFDLPARPMLPSIKTLTIRRDPIEGHRICLHRRNAGAVAAAGGMYHVVPAGVFRPAALAPAHQANDFSFWRNVQREFSEEFLGNAERDGNSVDPIDHLAEEPFASFERSRLAGDFRVSAMALVLEPLTLWVELLTVAVIEAPVFDELFSNMVAVMRKARPSAPTRTADDRHPVHLRCPRAAARRAAVADLPRVYRIGVAAPSRTAGPMRVLVTGATGFAGYAVAAALVDAGHEVTALTRSERAPDDYEPRRVKDRRQLPQRPDGASCVRATPEPPRHHAPQIRVRMMLRQEVHGRRRNRTRAAQ